MELEPEECPLPHGRREALAMDTARQDHVLARRPHGEGMHEIEIGAGAVPEERRSPLGRDDAVPSDVRDARLAGKARDVPRHEAEPAAPSPFLARFEEKLHAEADAEDAAAAAGRRPDRRADAGLLEAAGRLAKSAHSRH